MSKHRAEVRPRWGRIGLTAASAAVVVVAIAGGAGAFSHRHDTTASGDVAVQTSPVAAVPTSSPAAIPSAAPSMSSGTTANPSDASPPSGSSSADAALPAGSGSGRRAVFSQSDQRVWIVDHGTVERTYLVSGSVEDNLEPGTYHVYGRSLDAQGVDDSGYMRYFVRFAHGTDQGASIGFHEIPTSEPDGKGRPLQTLDELGTPESHGCIRQKTADAIAMWNFAHVGTKVVVVA